MHRQQLEGTAKINTCLEDRAKSETMARTVERREISMVFWGTGDTKFGWGHGGKGPGEREHKSTAEKGVSAEMRDNGLALRHNRKKHQVEYKKGEVEESGSV